MILVDTSIWVDHLRSGNKSLAALLGAGHVLIHPFIIGEIALGNLRRRTVVLGALADLPQSIMATHQEVMRFIGDNALFGTGIGWIDAHLLAATKLSVDTKLWTRDKRLAKVAAALRLAALYS